MHPPIYVTYLNGLDVAELKLTDDEILAAIESSLAAQGRGTTVIEPRMHLIPDAKVHGHFNVLRGSIGAPINLAGVKIVGDYVDNYQHGLPSEMAILNLFDPRTGMPKAMLDATSITEMRTGAVTALGAKYLARKGSKVLGHIGARGTAYWNVRLLDKLFGFDEIRVHSRRKESREEFAAELSRDLGKKVLRARQLGRHGQGRRHRGRSLAPDEARAAAQDRLDQEGRVRRALRHHERGRAVAHRHHVQDGGGRLGPVQRRPVRLPARPRRSRQAQRTDAARRIGPDRRRPEARPRARRRNHPVLAPRARA